MKPVRTIVAVVATLVALPVPAATVLYNFNNESMQGWSGFGGEAQPKSSGGIGGSGYFSIEDKDGEGVMFASSGAVAPANQLDKLGGVLSFALLKDSSTLAANVDVFGRVELYNGSKYVYADVVGLDSPTHVWNEYGISLANGAWNSGGQGATLSSVLSNLSSIRILLDNTTGKGEKVGLDNVSLAQVAAVPEPGEWVMMLAGLGLVGWAAARRRRGSDRLED